MCTKDELINVIKKLDAYIAELRQKYEFVCVKRDNAGENRSTGVHYFLNSHCIQSYFRAMAELSSRIKNQLNHVDCPYGNGRVWRCGTFLVQGSSDRQGCAECNLQDSPWNLSVRASIWRTQRYQPLSSIRMPGLFISQSGSKRERQTYAKSMGSRISRKDSEQNIMDIFHSRQE